MNAKLAHDLAPLGLRTLAAFRPARAHDWKTVPPLNWQGLHFLNRLGIAGGVDKDGASILDWCSFGAGFLEIGTITPKPQGPNPGRIIARDTKNLAVWNRMGFPGKGAHAAQLNLQKVLQKTEQKPKSPSQPKLQTPLFINIGKNRTTSNEDAAKDYVECIDMLAFAADAFVINISSPNTSGLRDLFRAESFRPFIGTIVEARNRHRSKEKKLPLLLKLSPDLEREDLERIVLLSRELGINGWIATNTTLAREPGSPFPPEGGVSGKSLAARSKAVLKMLTEILGEKRPDELLISVGGVMTPEDVAERLSLGADLVQAYAALIYHGPWFFDQVTRHINASISPLHPRSLVQNYTS